MDPRLLRAWELRPEVSLVLLLAAVLLVVGWRRLRRIPQAGFARTWRLVTYLGGLVVLALALLSPIDTISSYLLSMHMVQHLLLMMIAPVLLWIGNPFPFTMWGLPSRLRHWVGQLLSRSSGFRRLLTSITAPGVVWIAFVVVLVGWHDPSAYDAALRDEWVHSLEHLSFFVVAMLFWWHVTGAGPRLHQSSPWMRIALLLVMVPFTMGIGVVIALSSQPLYLNYLTVPRVLNLSVMEDQRLAGAIMWIPGSMMLILGTLIVISEVVGAGKRKSRIQVDSIVREPLPSQPG